MCDILIDTLFDYTTLLWVLFDIYTRSRYQDYAVYEGQARSVLLPNTSILLCKFQIFKQLRRGYTHFYTKFLLMFQIPASCETAAQSNLKSLMRDKCCRGRQMLTDSHDLTNIRHVDWLCKILTKERDMYGGIVSVVALCGDCVSDTDQHLDEYLAALPLDL